MLVRYHPQFEKDMDKYAPQEKIEEIFDWIGFLEEASTLRDVKNIKKLSGFKEFYRVRMGEYRLGFRLCEDGSVQLDRFLHRRNIYRKYP